MNASTQASTDEREMFDAITDMQLDREELDALLNAMTQVFRRRGERLHELALKLRSGDVNNQWHAANIVDQFAREFGWKL